MSTRSRTPVRLAGRRCRRSRSGRARARSGGARAVPRARRAVRSLRRRRRSGGGSASGLGDAMPAEPFDAGPDRGRERDREEEEDEDAPHLPDTEGERRDCERGGGRLRHADGRGRGRQSAGAVRWCLRGDHQTGARTGRRDVLCGTTRPALRRAIVTRAPKAKPPTWAKKATPPPFADAEVRPACPSTSW